MDDLISRQAAIDIVTFECGKWTGLAKEISKQIKQLPSAQPERTGYWIEFPSHNAYKCSECGRIIETADGKNNVYKHYPYCHCGARMKEGE